MKYGLLNNFKKMKKAIVTGASSGLGKYISIQLSKQKIKYLDWATNDIELFWGGVNVFSEKEK